MSKATMSEPVAWRSRYRSEPGMIGHYPWSYVEHSLRQSALNNYDIEPLITTDQAEAYADACVREVQQWISVDDRLPEAGIPVLVYTPNGPDDYPEDINIRFDFICPDYEYWHNHSEHYEHFLCIAKGGADCPMTGPAENAPYTHWMPLPAPPQQ